VVYALRQISLTHRLSSGVRRNRKSRYLYTNYCPYCFRAKALLRSKNVDFDEIDVTDDPNLRVEMERLSARRTVPQIFIDSHPIGGYEDARRLDATGELDRLLGRTKRIGNK
jgi:glutaredoxin 3